NPVNHTPKNPRILIVTPEVTYLPDGMGNAAKSLTAKAGGLADVSAALINALFINGADVHVTLPDYRTIFRERSDPILMKGLNIIKSTIPEERIHLAEDRAFFYLDCVYSNYGDENAKISLAFQREVINNIIPRVKPDIIHCNDWMTGLIPAKARQLNIPCLFTIHNIFSVKNTLSYIEDRGIDAASFWQHLFFDYFPSSYEEIRETLPVDFLTSGIFAAHYANTVSPSFLMEIVQERHTFVDETFRRELTNKWKAGCAVGILNAPEYSFDPETDKTLPCRYTAKNHREGKRINKRFFQKLLGLIQDERAPLFFWPSRLDTIQKGCQLLAEIIYDVTSRYWKQNLEIIFVADGEYQQHFKDIVNFHDLGNRVAICNFDELCYLDRIFTVHLINNGVIGFWEF
ncbi:MAG: glycogen/starch synthase, partial [Thermodesulfobacteriota bacterium]|nr:glycogen/starch synthase [Thermodesulfobacteriota bacterium]